MAEMNDRLEIATLGGLVIRRGGEPVTGLESRKVEALLVYLACIARPHPREVLAELLWPDRSQSRAMANLRAVLSNLRKHLAPYLAITRDTAAVNPEADVWLDVAEMEAMLGAGKLQEGVALFQGDFLRGFSVRGSRGLEDWFTIERERYRLLVLDALGRLVARHMKQGRYRAGIQSARRLLEIDPLAEPAYRQLMQLYAWSGQRAAALHLYDECARALQEELGLPPEEETVQLLQSIKDHREPPPLKDRAVSATIKVSRKHNLPVQLTPFVGREALLEGIALRLRDPTCRLLTLVGPGGSGKTRLALEVAATQLEQYQHGVFFVSLAPLSSAEAIVPTVAEAVGFSFYEGGEPQGQLIDYLRQKSMLLIMDNYEHLLEEVGLASDILKRAPGVKILATSRARLNVGGEHRFQVAGLDFPDWEAPATQDAALRLAQDTAQPTRSARDAAQFSAVKLFLQGARRARPGFELTDENAGSVVQVCRLVDGMPLAIRLAAAWASMLTPAEIAAEIEESLDFLETQTRDVPERQRSMRAVFDHSWKTLTERERSLMRALSVFRGGFTREAAQQVTGASLRELMALAGKSLLHRAATGRYEMHDLLRQYAVGKLEQSATICKAAGDRHSAYYAAALQGWEADLKGARQSAALAEMDLEIGNARAAWDWAAEQRHVGQLDQAIEGLFLFYEWRMRHHEGVAACRVAAERLSSAVSGDELRVLARIKVFQAGLNVYLGNISVADQLLQQSQALLNRPELAGQDVRLEKAHALRQMGHVASRSSPEEGARLYTQSLALYQAMGEQWWTAYVLGRLGGVMWVSGNLEQAKRLHQESLTMRQSLGDSREIADSLLSLSVIALHRGELEERERLVREGIEISRKIDYQPSIARGLGFLGNTLTTAGRFAGACSVLEECLEIYTDLGSRTDAAFWYAMLGIAKTYLGQYEHAHIQAQRALALAQESGNLRATGYSLQVLGQVALARKAYSEAREMLQKSVDTLVAAGARTEKSGVLPFLALAACRVGELAEAYEYLAESLQIAAEIQAFFPVMYAPPAIALLLLDQGAREQAIELYALASRYPLVANSPWFEEVVGKHVAAAAAALPAEVVAAARRRARGRDLEAIAVELLAQLAA